VVTVVDARNPLFYRCEDLEDFVREVNVHKRTMLLLNKADLLPDTVRRSWARYLKSRGIAFLFWSAKRATAVLEGKIAPGEEPSSSVNGDEEIRVWGREELLSRLEAEAESVVAEREEAEGEESTGSKAGPSGKHQEGGHASRVVVGFVGYPNVGKSSTINALVGEKKTGVTSTPGKTKHFQTLLLRDHPRLMLCDCPGLVFPSFSSSKAEMVAAGVLPIDRLTDNRAPMQIVAERVPRALLEEVLGITLPAPAEHEAPDRAPTAAELLRSFCRSRGYVGSSGLPDETKAARMLLKDYVDGKLLHCALPPGELSEDRPRGVAPVSVVRVGGGAVIGSERFDAEEESSEYETDSDGEDLGAAGGADGPGEEPPSEGPSDRNTDAATVSGKDSDVPGGSVEAGVAPSRVGGDDFDVLSSITGATSAAGSQRHRNRLNAKPDYKNKRKAARTKDRTWRAFQTDNDTDGMPIVRGMAKPVSHGAAAKASVAEQARKDLELCKAS
jgi:large subunit GTPase 1